MYTGLPAVFVLDICTVIPTLIASIYAWFRWSTANWHLMKSLLPMHPMDRTLFYAYHVPETLESWNCVLARNTAPHARNPSRAQLESLCMQGRAARYLVLVLLFFAVLRPALRPARRFFAWRRRNILERRKKSQDTARGQPTGDDIELQDGRADESKRSQSGFIEELPADRSSKVEMDEGAAFRELEGRHRTNELDGGIAAVEVEAMKGFQGR